MSTSVSRPQNANVSDDELFSRLFPLEIAWRDRQLFLQSHGYMLRPRLRPDWTPSWRANNTAVIGSEDSIALPVRLISMCVLTACSSRSLSRGRTLWMLRASRMAFSFMSNASRLATRNLRYCHFSTRRTSAATLEIMPFPSSTTFRTMSMLAYRTLSCHFYGPSIGLHFRELPTVWIL